MLATAPGSLPIIREKTGRRHPHRNLYLLRRPAFGGCIAAGSPSRRGKPVTQPSRTCAQVQHKDINTPTRRLTRSRWPTRSAGPSRCLWRVFVQTPDLEAAAEIARGGIFFHRRHGEAARRSAGCRRGPGQTIWSGSQTSVWRTGRYDRRCTAASLFRRTVL